MGTGAGLGELELEPERAGSQSERKTAVSSPAEEKVAAVKTRPSPRWTLVLASS